MICRAFAGAGLAVLLGSCASAPAGKAIDPAQAAPQASFQEYRDLVYTPASWPQRQTADLYVPDGPGPFPAVVVVHGGAWIFDDRFQSAGICKRLARHGYVAMNISYRLLPSYRFPAPLEDVQQALRWMQAHAAENHIDRGRMGAWGYSAGAELVALLATLRPGMANYAGDVHVNAVVAGGTPADLTLFSQRWIAQAYLGGTLAEQPARYRQASPAALVTPETAPMFLYSGTTDAIVPRKNTEEMKAALDAAGVPNEVFWVAGRGHLMTLLFDPRPDIAALHFLDAHIGGAGQPGMAPAGTVPVPP